MQTTTKAGDLAVAHAHKCNTGRGCKTHRKVHCQKAVLVPTKVTHRFGLTSEEACYILTAGASTCLGAALLSMVIACGSWHATERQDATGATGDMSTEGRMGELQKWLIKSSHPKFHECGRNNNFQFSSTSATARGAVSAQNQKADQQAA